jgi:hypothetical protein
MGNFIDLTGKTFGRLTVIKRVENRGKRLYWLCECSCGNEKIVCGTDLRGGVTKSCGCLQTEARYLKRKGNRYNLDGEYGVGYDCNDKEFYFDLEDYDKIKGYTWHINNYGYPRALVNGVSVGLHSFLIPHEGKTWIDHIDGNRADCRKKNLRVATYAQNGMNKAYMSTNTSGIIGVHFDKRVNFWYAQISINNKTVYVGCSKNKDEAIRYRLLAEKQYYKDFAPQRHLFEKYNII